MISNEILTWFVKSWQCPDSRGCVLFLKLLTNKLLKIHFKHISQVPKKKPFSRNPIYWPDVNVHRHWRIKLQSSKSSRQAKHPWNILIFQTAEEKYVVHTRTHRHAKHWFVRRGQRCNNSKPTHWSFFIFDSAYTPHLVWRCLWDLSTLCFRHWCIFTLTPTLVKKKKFLPSQPAPCKASGEGEPCCSRRAALREPIHLQTDRDKRE